MKSDKNKNKAIISIPSIDSLGGFILSDVRKDSPTDYMHQNVQWYSPKFYYVITVFTQQMDFSEWDLWMGYLDKVNKFSSIESNI